MTKSERKDLISRMVSMAKADRKVAHVRRYTAMPSTLAELKGEAAGFMRAARMVKGYATQARFKSPLRRAA